MSAATQVIFNHEKYVLLDGEKVVRKTGLPAPKDVHEDNEEIDSVIKELEKYIQDKFIQEMNFEAVQLSDRDGLEASSNFFVTKDWTSAEKIMIIAHNAAGSKMGIFSRSICLEQGLSKGSMLPYVSRAREAGYAVVILRPNRNSYTKQTPQGPIKIPLQNSQTPEIHAAHVFEIIEERCINCKDIALLAYGNGACLCKDIFIRDSLFNSRIKAFCTIEASYIVESDDALDIRQGIRQVAVNFECGPAPRGYRLQYRGDKLGCTSLSLGMPTQGGMLLPDGSVDVVNRGASLELALENVFEYCAIAETRKKDDGTGRREISLGAKYAARFATSCGVGSPVDAVIRRDPNAPPDERDTQVAPKKPETQRGGIFSRLFGAGSKTTSATRERVHGEVTVEDFELLKVVGKGAFGKVMLVRRNDGLHIGEVYAMKVLKKSVIEYKQQVEHTQAERRIMAEIKHPFLVQLRYAFQSEEKLYLITDYYNGGSLYYHLRRNKKFSLERTTFYAAQLVMAIAHLHNAKIIYRDLKLENVLMHSSGYVAITDFGLSKQGVDENASTHTFCGTPEYMAPDLFEEKPYGPAVDWWTLGILIFEMLNGKTPFMDKNNNKRLMFYRIQNSDPPLGDVADDATRDLVDKLLQKDAHKRLGCLEMGSAAAVMAHTFFESIDFRKLLEKKLMPPFIPELKNDFDLRYIPRTMREQTTGESFSEEKKGVRPGTKSTAIYEDFSYNEDTVGEDA